MADVLWNECDAYARHMDDNGRETVVFCSLGRHAAPGDNTEKHFDPELNIFWVFADEWTEQ
jgi:hypothetical protein